LPEDFHFAIAVDTDAGLLAPVVRDVNKLSLRELAAEMHRLVELARSGRLSGDQLQDGVFTITNLGMFGIDAFAAVINPPEGAILAVGKIRPEPVVWEGAVVAGQRLAMTLSCDHRVVDGAVGARFLAELRSLIERPTQMLVL
jgi:pyruvate dehydrogenase E2 component (dihydrolipoamide acetyltransferase)